MPGSDARRTEAAALAGLSQRWVRSEVAYKPVLSVHSKRVREYTDVLQAQMYLGRYAYRRFDADTLQAREGVDLSTAHANANGNDFDEELGAA